MIAQWQIERSIGFVMSDHTIPWNKHSLFYLNSDSYPDFIELLTRNLGMIITGYSFNKGLNIDGEPTATYFDVIEIYLKHTTGNYTIELAVVELMNKSAHLRLKFQNQA